MGRLTALVRPGAPVTRGHHLYRAGETATDCFVVRSGAFKTTALSADGREQVTGFHFPGEIVGFSGQADGTHHETVIAMETSTACQVPVAALPELWRIGGGPSLLRLIGQTERRHAHDCVNLGQPAADARVAGFLVRLARRMAHLGRDSSCLPLPMSRTELASYLGMTIECLSRVLARFTRGKLVTAERRQITLHEPAGLAALAPHLDT